MLDTTSVASRPKRPDDVLNALAVLGRKRCSWGSTPPDGDCAIHAALADPVLTGTSYPKTDVSEVREAVVNLLRTNTYLRQYLQFSIANQGELMKVANQSAQLHPFIKSQTVENAADLFSPDSGCWFTSDAIFALTVYLEKNIVIVDDTDGSCQVYYQREPSKGGAFIIKLLSLSELQSTPSKVVDALRSCIVIVYDGSSHFYKTTL